MTYAEFLLQKAIDLEHMAKPDEAMKWYWKIVDCYWRYPTGFETEVAEARFKLGKYYYLWPHPKICSIDAAIILLERAAESGHVEANRCIDAVKHQREFPDYKDYRQFGGVILYCSRRRAIDRAPRNNTVGHTINSA